jgi:hypothetical protein
MLVNHTTNYTQIEGFNNALLQTILPQYVIRDSRTHILSHFMLSLVRISCKLRTSVYVKCTSLQVVLLNRTMTQLILPRKKSSRRKKNTQNYYLHVLVLLVPRANNNINLKRVCVYLSDTLPRERFFKTSFLN